MQYQTTLAQVIHQLQNNQGITRSQIAELREEGYDITSLINRYSK